ncbi:precorrin-3B synthase [Streptomyces sp. NA02950]|uniref:precorrin-3B synthase n=1 Tax=Streptomyces sp. NA02950 TaxID=2742137 RepID=UPI0020CB21D9|nr:precorrin-3B synthase [Streptomyces sp. NA02950]
MPLPPTTVPPGDQTPAAGVRARSAGDRAVSADRGGRDDACPGALRLHPAHDGALARVRLPGGLLTGRQADVLAGVAEELGDGRMDLTSRGNLQLRGLAAECGAPLAERLRTAGLLPSDAHDRVRNIVASPLSGLDGTGYADVPGWARELDALLCAAGPGESTEPTGLSGLSGRFLFALDDGRGDVAALGADVTLIATPDGGAVLRMGPAGPAGGTGPVVRVAVAGDAPRAAALAALEFLTRAEESGIRAWRVPELPRQHAVTAEGLAARLADAGIALGPATGIALGPATGVVAGPDTVTGVGPDTGHGPPAPGPVGPPAPGPVAGPDGRHAVSVAVPLGRMSAAQWRLLAALASRGGSDELRVTPWRGVVLPGFTPEGGRAAAAELAEAGLVTDPDSPWLGVGACTGLPGCAKSLADVRADAGRTVARPVSGGPRTVPLPVYFSGCERRCGHPGGRWVDALATGAGYRITVRGEPETAGAPEGPEGVDVTAEQVADAVAAARGTR